MLAVSAGLAALLLVIIVVGYFSVRNSGSCPTCASPHIRRNPSRMHYGWHCLDCGAAIDQVMK